VRPRLDLYGADVSQVGIWKAVRNGTDERPVSLSTDLNLLDFDGRDVPRSNVVATVKRVVS
jgi:hypothetical protein